MRTYENILILDPDYASEEQEILKRITANIQRLGGRIVRFDDWSQRKLAYSIRKKDKGHYFYIVLEMENEKVPALDKFYRTYEPVLRHMLVRIDRKKKPMERPPEQVIFDEFEGEYA
jgi:small subunit ribosomal protein S6